MSTGSVDSAADLRALGQKWWLLALLGAVTVGFGVVLAFKPGKSVHAIAAILGVWLLIVGVVRLLQAIGATGERVGLVIVGVLAILVALLLLRHTTTTVGVLGFTLGVFWTIGGIGQLIHGFSADEGRVSWPVVLLGAIATVIGILCLVYPSLSLSILCVITGVGMIVYGVVEIMASLQVRRLKAV
jgi:uncharacterized membrane protein HdeD (DUF308 family)